MCATAVTRTFVPCRYSINPNEETMGSTPSGSAKPTIGAALPPHHEIDRDGGSRASAGGRT